MDLLQKAWDIKIENLSAGYKDKTVIKSMNARYRYYAIERKIIPLYASAFWRSFSRRGAA